MQINEKYPHDPDKKNISDYMGKDCDQINYCYKEHKVDGWEETRPVNGANVCEKTRGQKCTTKI